MTKSERKKEEEVLAVLNDLIVEIQSASIEKIAEITKLAREVLDREK